MINASSASFQGYIDNLMNTKHFTSVAIFARADSALLASNNGFPLTQAQIIVLMQMSDNTSTETSITVGGDRYILTKRHDMGVFLKKGGNGVVTQLTKQVMIVGLHDDKTKAEIVQTDMARVADYLVRHGF